MSTITGPTQGAERHAETVGRWQGRPQVARALRLLIILAPLILSVIYTWLAGKFVPAERLHLGRWTWIGLIFVTANLLLAVLRRLTARLLPLVALMKLTLVFPDQAPSRMKATLRKSNSRKMLRNITEARERGEESDEINNGDYVLQLLMEVNDHDRLTRGHSERVRVYSEMLGEEIGLSADDMNKLRWSALLHDVGKLTVPSEILNKPGRPTEDEWEILSGHPAAGVPLLEPLRPWLGDWIHSADQHHCRWDGTGYPENLAGTDISLAGRLVAIADAYDVMTSARSYKKPLSVELARQELTDCAGSQFDPNLVRAFLRISLGRLRTVGGPLAWLANLTGSAQLPVPIAGTVTTTAWSAGVATAGIVAATTAGIIAPPVEAPELLAFREPVVAAYDQVASVVEDESITIWLGTSSTNGAPIVTVASPLVGTVTSSNTPVRSEQLLDLSSAVGEIWQTAATYTPDPGFIGEDSFEFGACLDNGLCSVGTVTIEVLSSNHAPITAEDRVEVLAGRPVGVDVLVNDIDPDSDPLTIVSVGTPTNGVVRIVDGQVEYIADQGFEGVDTFDYTVTDIEGATSTTTVTITVRPLVVAPSNPVPVSDAGAGYEALEDTAFTTPDVTTNDELGGRTLATGPGDPTGLTIDVATTPVAGTLVNNRDGTFTYVPNLNANGTDSFSYVLVTPDGSISEPAVVTLGVTPVDDPPVVANDEGIGYITDEDTPFTTGDVTLNDTDPDSPITPLGLAIAQQAANGQVVDNADGTFTYTPNADFNGTDTFSYRFFDAAGLRSDAATVTVTVTAVNDAPVSVADGGDGFTTSEDTPFVLASVTANDSDVEDADLRDALVTIVDDTSAGALGTNEDGALLYSPNADATGTDTFTYTVTDSGGLASEPATVTITITPTNDAPVATDDGGAGYETDEDVPFTTPNLLENDSDQEADDLDAATIEIIDDPTAGVVTVNGDGTVGYTPATDFNGVDTFTYTVADDLGARSQGATVTIVVTAVNDAPVATDDSGPDYSTPEDTPFALPSIAANDTDVEDASVDADSITLVTLPTSGTLSLDPNGDLVYSPDLNFNGIDSFTYTITDADDLVSEPASVTIEVRSGNDPPVAIDDQGVGFTTAEDTSFITPTVTANDSDIEDGPADPTTVTVIDGVQNGALVNNGDGTFTYTPDLDFNGTDTFTYAFNDSGLLLSNVATVILSVTPVNDAPGASPDSGNGYTTDEDTAFTTADVTVNDVDIEDESVDATTATIVDSAANGTVVNNGDGTFSYSPDPDYNGDDTFTYTVTDSEGIVSAPGLVTITVTSINDTPIATNDGGAGFTTPEDVPLTTTVLTANDVDIEDTPLDPAGITILGTPSNGAVTNNGDGTVTYVPDADYNGDDTFTYTVTDSDGAVSNVATVTVSMTSGNDAPVALDDGGAAFATLEDTLLTTPNVATNDSDIEDGPADPTTVTVVDSVLNGTLTSNGDGTFDYLPNPDFNGTDSFTYHFNDSGLLLSNVATVTITIEPVNDAPLAADDAGPGFETLEDVEFTTTSVLNNDTDIEDGAPLGDTVSIVSDAAGTLTNNGDGTFDYLPNPDVNGTDTFTYTITDSDGQTSAPATVTITVEPVNDTPVANDDAGLDYTSPEDTLLTTPSVTTNDSDVEDGAADSTTVTVIGSVVNGTLTNNGDGTFDYLPNPDVNGTDTFTYTITDSDGQTSAPATVTITVEPVNDAPTAADDAGPGFETLEDVEFTTTSVLNNDTDIEDGAPLAGTVSVVSDAAGTLINNGDGTFDYLPNPDVNGTDTFTYTITDSDGQVSAPATVTITVEPVNDAPVANDDAGLDYTSLEDTDFMITGILANDTDVEDLSLDPSGITVIDEPANGVLARTGGGSFEYEPNKDFNGTDSFTYTITDSDGQTSAPATVTITVEPVNDAPVALPDAGSAFETDEDIEFITGNVTLNDIDPEDGIVLAPTASIVVPPAQGVATHNGDGTFGYTPAPNLNGTDSFTYTVTDSDGQVSEPALVTIYIAPVNDAPVGQNDGGVGFTTAEDTTFISADVTINDGDVEDGAVDPATTVVVTGVTDGQLQHLGNGEFTYAPNPDFSGTDSFTYSVTDSDGLTSAPATVTIDVTPVNDAPIATDDTGAGFTTAEDTPLTTPDVTVNDSDIEDGPADASSTTIASTTTNGSLSNNGDGTFSYIPNDDFNGPDSFTYTITDSEGQVSEPATVSLTVTGDNDVPVAQDDGGTGYTTTEDTTFVTFVVTTNDSDLEDGTIDPATLTITSPAIGSVQHQGNGRFLYTPIPDFNGTDSFTYTVGDSSGARSEDATVTITLTPVNDAPMAADDAGVGFTTNEDVGFVTSSVSINDVDAEDGAVDAATVALVDDVDHGVLSSNNDGTFSYTPFPDFFGNDTFTYTVTDADGLVSLPGTVTITVAPVNDVPVAADDSGIGFTTPEDVSLVTNSVLTNDDDREDGSGVATLVFSDASLLQGNLTNNGDGTFLYTPSLNFNGTDTFTYSYMDSDGAVSNTATVTITVTGGNDSPVAADDGGIGFSTDEDVPFTTPAVTANDSDTEDGPADPAAVTINVVNSPVGDLVNNGDGTFGYTPLPNFNGTDTFTYVFSDSGLLLSNLATVTIIVGPINDAPDAVDDTGPAWATDEDVAFTTPSVLDNDSDVEDGAIDPATISMVVGASNGTVTHNGDSTFTYTPNADYFGNDAFVYSIADSDGEPAQARVELTIAAVNDPPVANDDSYATKEDTPITFTPVIDNDADLEDGPGSSTSFQIESDPTNGDLTHNGGGTLTYQPDLDFFGTDTFTYSYTDSGGLTSNTATVAITVEAENDLPVAADDAFTVDEDDLVTTSDVSVNDLDPEDGAIDPTTTTIVSNVSDGALTDNGDGTFTYEPAADFDGTDSFTYIVTDAEGAASAPATVTFTVTPVSDAPVLTNPGVQSALIATAFELAIVASDVDGDTLTYSATSLPAGLALDTGTGKITGIPATGTAGTYSVRIDVEDDDAPMLSDFVEFDIVIESWRASTMGGNVAITEFLYLGTQDPTQEFVELYNAGPTGVDVTGWVITDTNRRDDGPGDVRYVIPAFDASGDPSILEPGEHLVFWMAWDGEMTEPISGLEYVLNNFTRKLNNTGDDIWLIDGQGGLVDYVAFGGGSGIGTPPPADLGMWDDTYQASLMTNAGVSLALTPHGIDGNTSACWEPTGSGDAADRCPDALETTDSDSSSVLTSSVGFNNNHNLFAADAGGPYSIDEGDSLALDGSDTDNSPSTWQWDLDGDGRYDDAVGPNPIVPWETLVALGIDDDGSYPIALQVDGGIGKDDAVLTISNTAPTVSVSGNSQAQAGMPYTLTLNAEDQGDDEITGWIISWGDGTIETITGNPSAVTHVYANVGFTYDILLTAIDEDGTYMQNELLVPSFDADNIFRYEANTGTFLQSFATGDNPVLAKVGPDGLLYVSHDHTSDIWRFNPETGAFIDIFIVEGDSSLDGAEGFAFGPQGDLYVADYQGDRVMQYDKDTGTFVKVFASAGLDGPYGVVFGPNGDLYVGSYKSHHVERFDGTNGSTNVTFVTAESGGLKDPEQMAFGPDGNLYIASYSSRNVLRFDGTTGDFIDVFVAGATGGVPSRPSGLAFGPDGNLYVSDYDDESVRRFDGVTGNYIDDYVPAGAASGGLTKPSMISFLPSLQVRVAT